MDRVSSMQSFVKVVENGGFAAAARQLNLSPSLVTTHIKSLEDRLGVRLLRPKYTQGQPHRSWSGLLRAMFANSRRDRRSGPDC
jgi:predicted subunit of tRNA(5-methylaminomethyl-2-thiouridylate) methyltransferase